MLEVESAAQDADIEPVDEGRRRGDTNGKRFSAAQTVNGGPPSAATIRPLKRRSVALFTVKGHKVRLRVPAHRGPDAVATVFHTVAILALEFGIIGAIGIAFYAHYGLAVPVNRSVALALAGVLGAVFLASLLAFFGYVLDLLREIADNTRPEDW